MGRIYEESVYGGADVLPCRKRIQRYARYGTVVDVDCGYAKRMTGIPEDDEGLNISILQSHIEKFDQEPDIEKPAWQNCTYRYVFYGVPTFSNPTGSIMSLSRRKRLLEGCSVKARANL